MIFDKFVHRHIGPREDETTKMLKVIGVESKEELIENTIPSNIRLKNINDLTETISEPEYLSHIWEIAQKNKLFKTYIGLGYYNTYTPAVIQRNIFENPSWYTPYTPYQAEISQGRLEALLNFQTMIIEITSMPIANASLLDEGTAAAEAMLMFYHNRSEKQINENANIFYVDKYVFPHTLDVLITRSKPFGIKIETVDIENVEFHSGIFGILIQTPNSEGKIVYCPEIVEKSHQYGIKVAFAADLMSLVLITPPGKWGADVVLGSTQRFGIPMGYGGPHAAYFATKEEYKRMMPGRIIGISKDKYGNPAYRMALQTREQHIKREKATSNICTSQALLAIMAGMYAVYHGKEGLTNIALHIHYAANTLAIELEKLGYTLKHNDFFDTILITLPNELTSKEIKEIAEERQINLRYITDKQISLSLDETVNIDDINNLIELFAIAIFKKYLPISSFNNKIKFNEKYLRKDDFLKQKVFNNYRSEIELMRYIKKLERKDISLTHSMISLGSCTMKLTAAIEMLPLSWPEFANIHPFAPLDQVEGYHQMMHDLGNWLCKLTGFSSISFQPNSGAAGEYAGLMVIQEYHRSRGEGHRNIALIPASAHGTNPASAAMAGLKVVIVKCDDDGNISIEDLKQKVNEFKNEISCIMITYPSTHGVFEENIKDITSIVHHCGGQVYMDGANMNAQVGLTSPAMIGADLCHINLHKTFAIPHGGGGPGMGPICVADHLVEFLPTHTLAPVGGAKGIHAVASSPWGSAFILQISYAYMKLMGFAGLKEATIFAIMNANYLKNKLKNKFKILYVGKNGMVGHEFIVDCREFKKTAGVSEIDIAKRLMDYGYHAPTVSFPVPGTLMIEPTESESLHELDRFVEVMNNIYEEIQQIAKGEYDMKDNVFVNAPHTDQVIASDSWEHKYSRQKAAFPLPWIRENKFWPGSSRIDDAYGDRNLICSCTE